MVDVLLASSYYLKYDPKQVQKMKPYPPLATLYAAAQLRRAGFTVAIFDAMLSEGEHEFEEALRKSEPNFVALYEDSFNFLTKMCLTRMREAACRMASGARQMGTTVIAAGPDVSDNPGTYLGHGAHFAISGEADHSLLELVSALSGRTGATAISEIAGIVLPDPDAPSGVQRTVARAAERFPDEFAFPAWDLVDVERYREVWSRAHGFFSLNMVSTRGCPFSCNWCAKPIWGQRYAMRSPANVAEELALVKRLLRPDHIWFADDIFGLRPQWVAEFAAEVRSRGAAVPFTIQSRVDLMSEQAVLSLAEAGCKEVWLGVESGSQAVLDAMDKGIDLLDVPVVRERLRQAGIRAGYFLQLGFPGESFDDLLATASLVRRTLPDEIGVSVSYPLPGTKFHKMVQAELGSKRNWTDSQELAMMFQGTYRTAFYRRLHGLLHRELELRLRGARGNGDAAEQLRAELYAVEAEWAELERVEPQHRSMEPSKLVRAHAKPEAPDLSKSWN